MKLGAKFFYESHRPPREAWIALLESKGFQALPLRGAARGDGGIRLSRDGHLIEFPGPDPSLPSGFWVRGEPPSKPDWLELGPGMAGFEGLIRTLATTSGAKKSLKTVAVKAIDPKEFHY
jgi:hypothetical protein